MSGFAEIGDAARLERLASAAAHLVPHRLPIYRAAADGLIAVIEPRRETPIPSRAMAALNRPGILLIGDDDETPTGPAAWQCGRRARKWGSLAIVHAAGGDSSHYRAAVVAAGLHRRLLLIETTSEQRDAWLSFLAAAMPVAVITTRPGDLHPRQGARVFQ